MQQRKARQDQVSVDANATAMLRVKNSMHTQRPCEQLRLIVPPLVRRTLSDFLKQDDVWGIVPDHGHDALEIIATVEATYSLVDVPAHHSKGFFGRRSMELAHLRALGAVARICTAYSCGTKARSLYYPISMRSERSVQSMIGFHHTPKISSTAENAPSSSFWER
jgi:hypothetical protein